MSVVVYVAPEASRGPFMTHWKSEPFASLCHVSWPENGLAGVVVVIVHLRTQERHA